MVNIGKNFRPLGPVKVRVGELIFGGILSHRLLRIEKERQDAVEVSRSAIHGGDVFVECEIACTNTERLLRRRQKQTGQSGQPFLFLIGSLFVCGHRVVVAGGFRKILNLLQ